MKKKNKNTKNILKKLRSSVDYKDEFLKEVNEKRKQKRYKQKTLYK